MLTLIDIIAIAIACKLWSVISDLLADLVVDILLEWKDSGKYGYIAVPNEGVDQEAFYAHSWEELETKFRERDLKPSDFLIETASMSCHPIARKIPTSVPPPRKRDVVDINMRVK